MFGYRTKIVLVCDVSSPSVPVPTNTNGPNYKSDYGGFSFGAALLAPPKSGRFSRFSFVFSSSSCIDSVTGSTYGDKGTEEKKEDSLYDPDADLFFGASL